MKFWKPLLLTAVLTLASVTPATAAGAGASGPTTPDCAWHPLGYRTSNVAYPDTNSQYWLLHYTVQDGLSIALDGRYPDARYASFASYDAAHDSVTGPGGAPAVLTDHQIAPDRGSRNPYQYGGRAGGKFTVTVAERAGRGSNALPLSSAGTPQGAEGTVIYRVYLADGTVRLPKVTFRRDGHRVSVPPCADAQGSGAATPDATRATGPAPLRDADPARPAFARQAGSGLYPNPDNAYVSAGFDAPPAGDVLVVRGKAPASTTGHRARPWPDPAAQVRYWSMCDNLWWGPGEVVANPLPDGTVDPGCRTDSDTHVAADGTYTYVVGTEQQRAAITRIPGATFVPLSSATPTDKHVLILRNMLAAPGFAEAVQRVPTGSDAARTEAVMGAYYPRATYCSLSLLAASGPEACTAGREDHKE
ncbi:hypothetical protein [Streptomyces sp. NPDC049813]|uniref:hypothetical protein n=1 Tax=Streptomyces sp. NPDC049813 TaxID=3365597 RepID=UPI0037A67F7B